jgi:hypothetical protein
MQGGGEVFGAVLAEPPGQAGREQVLVTTAVAIHDW